LRECEIFERATDLNDADGVGLLDIQNSRCEELSEIGDAELRHLSTLGMVQAAGSRCLYSLDFYQNDHGYTETVLREFARNSHPSVEYTNRNQQIRDPARKNPAQNRNCYDTTCYDLDLCPGVNAHAAGS
jgi:hypothetical protein